MIEAIEHLEKALEKLKMLNKTYSTISLTETFITNIKIEQLKDIIEELKKLETKK